MERDKTTVLPLAPNLIPKKGEFRFKREAEGAGEEKGVRERHPFCLDLDGAFPFHYFATVAWSKRRWAAWRRPGVGDGSGGRWRGVRKVAPLNELFWSKSASFLGKFGASSPLPGTWSGSLGSGTIASRLVGRRSTVLLGPQTWTRSRPPLIPSPQQPQV